MRSIARRILPWVVAAGLLFWITSRVPLDEVARALATARLGLFVPLLLVCVGLWLTLDALVLERLVSRLHVPLTRSEALRLRGLTYLLTPLHWHLGRAAVVALLHTRYRLGVLEATSLVALQQALNVILLCALASLGLASLDPPIDAPALRATAAAIGLCVFGYLAWLRGAARRPVLLVRFRELAIHDAHRRSTAGDLLFVSATRFAYFAAFAVVYWAGSQAFGFALPAAAVLATVPVVLAVSALPISPAGLGTQQAAMLVLFAPYGEAARILAFGLCLPVLVLSFRCGIGAAIWAIERTREPTQPDSEATAAATRVPPKNSGSASA